MIWVFVAAFWGALCGAAGAVLGMIVIAAEGMKGALGGMK